MSYSVIDENERHLGDFASTGGMKELVDTLESMPYPKVNDFLETGITEEPYEVAKELKACVTAFQKKLKPTVTKTILALGKALVKAKQYAQIVG